MSAEPPCVDRGAAVDDDDPAPTPPPSNPLTIIFSPPRPVLSIAISNDTISFPSSAEPISILSFTAPQSIPIAATTFLGSAGRDAGPGFHSFRTYYSCN